MTNSPHLSGIYIFMSIIYSGRCGLLFGLSGASFADTDLHLDDMMNEPYSPLGRFILVPKLPALRTFAWRLYNTGGV